MGIEARQVGLKLRAKIRGAVINLARQKQLRKLAAGTRAQLQKSGPKSSYIGSGHHCRENGCWRANAITNFDPPILLGGGEADPHLADQSAGVIIGLIVAAELDTFLVEHGVIRPQEMEVISRHWL